MLFREESLSEVKLRFNPLKSVGQFTLILEFLIQNIFRCIPQIKFPDEVETDGLTDKQFKEI